MFRGRAIRVWNRRSRSIANKPSTTVSVSASTLLLFVDLTVRTLVCARSHLRQLIYIALCRPPAATQVAQGKGKGKASGDNPFGSPTKPQRKETKTSYRPSAKASEAARRLLSSYAMTNLPESLIRAIPCYNFTESERTILPRSIEFSVSSKRGEEDSVIAQKSVTLLDCGNCWNLLKPGLVSGGSASSWTLLASGRVAEDVYLDDDVEQTQTVVGDTAWPLLTWLVDLFEKDESLVKDYSQGNILYPQYQTYLLSRNRSIFCTPVLPDQTIRRISCSI